MGAATEAGTDGSGFAACAAAVAAAFCTACTVDCRSVDDGAALAGVTPTAVPTASTSPHVSAPMEVSVFRLMVSLLFCEGWTPCSRGFASYPTKRRSPDIRAKV